MSNMFKTSATDAYVRVVISGDKIRALLSFCTQGRRQDFFQGGSGRHIFDFQGGRRPNFCSFYGQNKKIAEPGGSADSP